jgi:BA14K-like protein
VGSHPKKMGQHLRTHAAIRALVGALLVGAFAHAGLAQTTGSVSPTASPEPSANGEPPPGGCMPIGVTASGDVVFPFQCKGFIEQHRGATEKSAPAQQVNEANPAREEKPSASEGTPAGEQKAASKSPEEIEPPTSDPAVQPVETVPIPKRQPKKGRESDSGPAGCAHFRSYDASSGTYTDLNGRRRTCRPQTDNIAGAGARPPDH